jgi:hypothetical protein
MIPCETAVGSSELMAPKSNRPEIASRDCQLFANRIPQNPGNHVTHWENWHTGKDLVP